ncbi:MAG: hypothetical protein AAFO69_12335 [Bacteroidota bacterium]
MVHRYLLLQVIFIFLCANGLLAQVSLGGYERLALIDVKGRSTSEAVNFDFQFETPTKLVNGSAISFMEGYDSIAIQTYLFIKLQDEKVLKVQSFIINKETNHRLKWITAVNYVETDKEQRIETKKLVSGKFIQFGAYRQYDNAVAEMGRLIGFEIEMIKVDDQYKLISPYRKGDYTRARTRYPEKNVWVVNYNQKMLISVDTSEL